MTAAKKQWKKPELRILVRSRPEEAVLAGCKFSNNGPIGPDDPSLRCKKKGSNCADPAKS